MGETIRRLVVCWVGSCHVPQENITAAGFYIRVNVLPFPLKPSEMSEGNQSQTDLITASFAEQSEKVKLEQFPRSCLFMETIHTLDSG